MSKLKIKKKPKKVVKLKKKPTKEPQKVWYDKAGIPIKMIDAKGDTLYNRGTRQSSNVLTGVKGKKEILWMKKQNPKDF